MKKLLALLLGVSLLAGCAPAKSIAPTPQAAATQAPAPSETAAPAKAKYQKITPEQAKQIMDENADAIILDVRTPEEYAGGHIKNAVLLPDREISSKAAEVLPDKSAEILVYCRSGRRSAAAAKELVDMGYTNVADFGGIADWPYETVT